MGREDQKAPHVWSRPQKKTEYWSLTDAFLSRGLNARLPAWSSWIQPCWKETKRSLPGRRVHRSRLCHPRFLDRLSYWTRLKKDRAGEALRLELRVKIRAVKSPSGRCAKVRFVFRLTERVGGIRKVSEVVNCSACPDQKLPQPNPTPPDKRRLLAVLAKVWKRVKRYWPAGSTTPGEISNGSKRRS